MTAGSPCSPGRSCGHSLKLRITGPTCSGLQSPGLWVHHPREGNHFGRRSCHTIHDRSCRCGDQRLNFAEIVLSLESLTLPFPQRNHNKSRHFCSNLCKYNILCVVITTTTRFHSTPFRGSAGALPSCRPSWPLALG